MDFFFDEWVLLAKEDPNGFEDYRTTMIETVIAQADPDIHQMLKGLQFRIDMERRKSRTPMASCIKLNTMLFDYFYNEYVPDLNLLVKGQIPVPKHIIDKKHLSGSLLFFPDSKPKS